MAEPVYSFRAAAQAAIDAKREELLRQRRLGLVTSEYVRRTLHEFMAREMAAARQLTDERALVGVRCPNCKREHIMPGDVKAYRCPCSPHTDRASFIGRFALT